MEWGTSEASCWLRLTKCCPTDTVGCARGREGVGDIPDDVIDDIIDDVIDGATNAVDDVIDVVIDDFVSAVVDDITEGRLGGGGGGRRGRMNFVGGLGVGKTLLGVEERE